MSFFNNAVFDDDLEDEFTSSQRVVSIFLYISLFAHGLEVFLENVGVLEGIIPALGVIAAVTAILFFIMECFILPPVGLLVMTVVAALLSWVIPYFVAFMVRSLIESILFMVIGGLIMALSVGVVVVVVDGIIIGAVVAPLMITPFLAGGGAMGITVLTGAAITAGVDAGVRRIRPSELLRPIKIVINLLLVLVLVWPVLTWTGTFQGAFALKPVQVAQQQKRSFAEENISINYQRFFEEGNEYHINGCENWTFEDGFYDSYIYPGRNTFAQGATPSAANDTTLAFCLNGMVYLVNTEANELYHATAYPLEREEAIVLVGQEAFLCVKDQIALIGPSGRYLWKDTNWTSDFEKLSKEKQYERLYAILEEQNDGANGEISIEDVAVVAYAQRNGLLLYYDTENHCAYFGQKGKKGKITILRQSAVDTREEATSFTPHCDSENLPYTMINETVVAYIDKDQIIFQGVDEEWDSVHYTNKTHDGETHPFVSFHVLHDADGNEYFAYQDSEDIICLEMLGSPVMEAYFEGKKYDAVYSVGSYVYGIVYDSDDLANQFTYVNDLQEDTSITEIWTDNWSWDRIQLHEGLWVTEEEEEETIPWEELPFIEKYPTPDIRTSVGQVGLYMDNVVSPSQYYSYRGPVSNFYFRYPSILYEEVEYTYSEDGSEVELYFYCIDDPSSLRVTLRPNEEGTDHKTLMENLQKSALEEMVNARQMRSGSANEEGTASVFYLTGYAADNTGLICTRLCWVDNENIMEMELRMPQATSNEDQARKDFYVEAMYACCGFGSREEPPAWFKFKKDYGL